MFAKLFGGGSKSSETTSNPSSSLSSSSDIQQLAVPEVEQVSIEFTSNGGGGKGWPIDASYLFYHKYQGLLCVGTNSGSIFVYGDGFQFLRPWISDDPVNIISMQAVGIQQNLLFVAFGDNSMALFELPTLTLISVTNSSWLDSGDGDVSCVYSDDAGGKSFVYIGTSVGKVFVLDVKGSIRECDYVITLQDCGLSGEIAVADIQICPKDEKYLAIAFDGTDGTSGATVIFDLTKRKVFKEFKIGASTTMCWSHVGETLYVGNRMGDVFQFTLEKESKIPIYRSNKEKFEDECKEEPIVIRRLLWLAPQVSTGNSSCLFVLLAHSDDDPPIKNTIVGLAPDMGTNKDGTLNVIFALPPTHNEEVLGFRLVPSVSPLDITRQITPSLLLLTQKVDPYTPGENIERNLKMLKCPDGNLSVWEMEIGSLPEPCKSTVVLPGLDELSCIAGAVPSTNKNSFLNALYATSEYTDRGNRVWGDDATAAATAVADDEGGGGDEPKLSHSKQGGGGSVTKASRRVSTSDFFTADTLISPEFELVLATGSDSSIDIVRQCPHNTVVLGHADGNLIFWAVSRPAEGGAAIGRCNLWFPVRIFKFGSVEVSAIYLDDQSPVFAAGNIAGSVAVWETCDSTNGLHYSDYFNKLLKKSKTNTIKSDKESTSISIKDMLAESISSNSTSAEDGGEEEDVKFTPDSWRQSYQFDIGEEVTALSFYSEICCLAIGSTSGNVYLMPMGDLPDGLERQDVKPTLANVSSLPRRGDVVKIMNGTYLRAGTVDVVPAFYLFYSSGGIGVLNPDNGELFCYSLALTDSKTFNIAAEDEDGDASSPIIDGRNAESFTGVIIDSRNVLVTPLTLQKYMESKRPKHVDDEVKEVVAAPEEKKSFWSVIKSTDVGSIKMASAAPSQLDASPRYLLLSRGRHLIQLDIAKFCDPSINTSGRSGRKSVSVDIDNSVVMQKVISRTPITCSQVLHWTEEASRAWSKPLPSLALVNCDGTIIVTSVRDKSTWGHIDLIEGILSRPAKFEQGFMLSNGDCFLVKSKSIVYSATVSSDTHIICNITAPVQGKSEVIATSMTDQLASGREKIVAKSAADLKKRRQSIFTLTSGPTDLEMVFQKTKEPRRKKKSGAFGGGSGGGGSDSDEEEVTVARSANNKLMNTHAVMADTKLAFLERGEKLKQMQIRGERMQSNAEEYKRGAKAYKDRLKAQSDRWGFF